MSCPSLNVLHAAIAANTFRDRGEVSSAILTDEGTPDDLDERFNAFGRLVDDPGGGRSGP